MKVSLTDACRLLGQSARQVRYRIRSVLAAVMHAERRGFCYRG